MVSIYNCNFRVVVKGVVHTVALVQLGAVGIGLYYQGLSVGFNKKDSRLSQAIIAASGIVNR